MSRKNFNTTVDEKTIEEIDRLAGMGKSKGQVIDEAVAMLVSKGRVGALDERTAQRWFQQTWTRLDEIPDLLRGVIEEFKAKKAEKVPVEAISRTLSNGFMITCKHCGENGRGAGKYATICYECKAEGHTGEARECPRCTAGQGI